MSGRFLHLDDGGPLPDRLRGGVIAIGNFDGVHRGHQAVLTRALELAREIDRPALALTFEPHPNSFFRPEEPLYRLTPPSMKADLIRALGLDCLVERTFDGAYAQMEAEQFITLELEERLAAAHIVAGYDFHFGKARKGTPEFLKKAGEHHGFSVTHVEALNGETGQAISSSRIRQSLADGDLAIANDLLGYRYRVSAMVRRGRQAGRQLGFPTANMQLDDGVNLRHGIYAVRFRGEDGILRDGVASFGRRPTFDNGPPLFETWLFDFEGDLYGQSADVSLFAFLREELRFDEVDALIEQMKADATKAREILAQMAPLSELDAAVSF